jgi:fatty acid desaturase
MSKSGNTSARQLKDYLSPDEFRALQVFSPLRVVLDIVITWSLILGAIAATATWPQLPILVISFVLIASRQLALTHLVHDASHYRLFRSKRLNDLLGDLLLAGPVAISTQSYRSQHLPHHQYLGDFERDTDQRSWYSIRGMRFCTRTLLTLLGWEAVATFRSYASVGSEGGSASGLLWRLCCAAISNSLLLAYCWWLGQPLLYFVLWFLPLLTLTMLLQNYRVIAEHQTEEYAARDIDRQRVSFVPPLTRTLQAGPLGKLLLGPMNFHYHHEHHLAPSVPYHQLPKMHRQLVERGYYKDHSEALGGGYANTLWGLIFPVKQGTPNHG